jgi:hypothetical protein
MALVLVVVLMVVMMVHPARHAHLYARRQVLAKKVVRVGDIRRVQLVQHSRPAAGRLAILKSIASI